MRRVAFSGLILLCLSGAFAQSSEPTKQEIADAYRSKSAWRTGEIRGWKLRFRRLGEHKFIGERIRRYEAIARQNGSCFGYRITETMPEPGGHIYGLRLFVEPGSAVNCR